MVVAGAGTTITVPTPKTPFPTTIRGRTTTHSPPSTITTASSPVETTVDHSNSNTTGKHPANTPTQARVRSTAPTLCQTSRLRPPSSQCSPSHRRRSTGYPTRPRPRPTTSLVSTSPGPRIRARLRNWNRINTTPTINIHPADRR